MTKVNFSEETPEGYEGLLIHLGYSREETQKLMNEKFPGYVKPKVKAYVLPNGSDGLPCKECKIIFAFVEPNQKDDKSYVCYSCRR